MIEFDPYGPAGEAARIRRAIASELKPCGTYDGISFQAYSREERDAVAALLTPEERAVVRFTWLEWSVRP